MKISAPIVTLIAGGALAGGLLVANGLTAGGSTQDTSVQVAGSAADEAADDAEQAEGEDAGQAGAADEQADGQADANGDENADENAGEKDDGEGAADADQAADQNYGDDERITYAGRVKGGGPLLAISIRNGTAIAYLCDGKLESWLKGKAEDGRITLTGTNASLTATINEKRARGSVTVGKRTWEFHAPTAKPKSGIWRATAEVRGARVEAGWVVLDDGTTQAGMFTRNGAGGTTAPRLDVTDGTATIDGQELRGTATNPLTGAGF
jgi:hypothetical protein